MTLEVLDWLIIIGFLLLIISIGISYTNIAGKNLTSFFLGGRNLPWYIAGISMVATTFAADTPLAVTELVGQSGIAGNWLWWSFMAGGMLTTFFFAQLWRKANVLTEVELCEIRYSGKPAKYLRVFKAFYLGLFINAIIIAWVNVALMSLLEVFFDISTSRALLYTAGAMTLVAVYSSLSGLLGIAITDVIQFFVAMVGCILLAILVLNSEQIGGIDGLKAQLNVISETTLNFFPSLTAGNEGNIGKTLGLSVGAFFAYAGVQWWASWYPGAEPGGGGYVAQRMMSTRSEKDAVYATLLFQIVHYCIRPWPWILVGLCAIVLYPDLPEADIRLGYVYAMKDFLPTGMKGLLLVAFFAAYMSTISTQLNWGASYLVNDFYKRIISPEEDFVNETAANKNYIFISRLATIFLMLTGLVVTTQITTISGAWSFLMACGAGLGMVLILRWYWWRINAWSEISATIAPFIAYGTLTWLNYASSTGQIALSETVLNLTIFPNDFLITVLFTTIVWIVVTFLTKPTSEDTLQAFYNRVRPDGAWNYFKNQFEKHYQYDYGFDDENKQAVNQIENKLFSSNVFNLLMCWIGSLIMTYGTLFLIGKLIFKEWQEASIIFGMLLLGALILRFFMPRTRMYQSFKEDNDAT